MSELLTNNGGEVKPFRLSKKFIGQYQHIKPPFGFGGLGEITYMRTYSRLKCSDCGSQIIDSIGDEFVCESCGSADIRNEQWWETIQRVVEGTYTMQKKWIDYHGLGWNAHQAQYSAQEMYDRMFNMKFLPPGRGLWAMGSPIITEKGLYAALNNCGFVSTESLKDEPAKPFIFAMDMSMLGVGIGFDTRGTGMALVKGPGRNRPTIEYRIPDTREGWVESVRLLLDSYFYGLPPVSFNYSDIRPAGRPIKTFGGIAAGPEPLIELHKRLTPMLNEAEGSPTNNTLIVDIMNLMGKCVVSGNVRRTALIAFGKMDDEYLDLKDYKVNPHRKDYGWTSNNSIMADVGMNYHAATERSKENGEPGYLWLENARTWGRMGDLANDKDSLAMGANPCVEQTLESYELCCLVENFPYRHETKQDFLRTLKFSYLYAKTVTLGKTHWPETNRVLLRNRRIGCSVSGITQFLEKNNTNMLKEWLEEGYRTIQNWDTIYSKWLVMPNSIKTTSIKPSGTVSLLCGSTPGCHYPESRYYIRRIRISKTSPLLEPIKKANYKIEEDELDKNAMVVEVPVDVGLNMRTVGDVSMWEQLSLAAFLQKYWADNQVSCTISFDPETEGDQIEPALNYYQYQLKGISFLPRRSKTYPQMPYEKITEAEYKERIKSIKPIDFSQVKKNMAITEKYCDGDVCEIELKPN